MIPRDLDQTLSTSRMVSPNPNKPPSLAIFFPPLLTTSSELFWTLSVDPGLFAHSLPSLSPWWGFAFSFLFLSRPLYPVFCWNTHRGIAWCWRMPDLNPVHLHSVCGNLCKYCSPLSFSFQPDKWE